MSIPYFCRTCGTVIGVESTALTLGRMGSEDFDSSVVVDCPGKGNHPKPTKTEHTRLFGLIKQVTLEYPETRTSSQWEEYAGPPKRFWLWVAIVFGTERYPNGSYAGVTVNGKWAWWDFKIGLYGDGVQELSSLQPTAA